MQIKVPKCPECGRWLYIDSYAPAEKRVDTAPTVFIYWTCECDRADQWPLEISFLLGQPVAAQPHSKHNESDE